MESFNSVIRCVIISLFIVVFIRVAHIERMVDAMAKTMQVEVAK